MHRNCRCIAQSFPDADESSDLDSVQAVAILVKEGGIGVFIVPSALIPETHSARLLLIALSL